MKYHLLLFLPLLFLSLPLSADLYDKIEIPVALQFQNNPIANDCIKDLLSVEHWGYDDGIKEITLVAATEQASGIQQEQEQEDADDVCWYSHKDSFRWEYLGTLPNDIQVVCAYEDFGGRNTCVTIGMIKRIGDVLRRVSSIMGQDYSAEIKDDSLYYSYAVGDLTFMDMVIELYPELKPLYDRSSKRGLGYGVGSFCGCFTNKVVFLPDGSIATNKIDSFHCAEGWSYRGTKTGEEMKVLALNMLRDIDEDKPEALKEDGIAYSNNCFRMLLEDDLRNGNSGVHSIELSLHKNDPCPEDQDYVFGWEYIGQYKDCYCIYAELHNKYTYNKHHEPHGWSGIYTIAREGDCLKKVACLARQTDENSIYTGNYAGMYQYDGRSFALVDNQLTYYHHVSFEKLKHFFVNDIIIENKGINYADNRCGKIKIVLSLSDDGLVENTTIAGFCPDKKDFNIDSNDTEQSQLTSLDDMFLYKANEFYDKRYVCGYYGWKDYVNSNDLRQILIDAVKTLSC